MDIKELLRSVELFDGLADDDLAEVAQICMRRTFLVQGRRKEGLDGDAQSHRSQRHTEKEPVTLSRKIFP